MAGWKKNIYRRREIDRAGEILCTDPMAVGSDFRDWLKAFEIMDTWRSSHSFPLNTLQVSLRKRSKKVDNNAEVVQRLKRAQSVTSKLQRNPEMKLSRMQDLGGCRSIVDSSARVYEIREIYQDSRDRHKLANEKDYIASPKDSGYRGLHQIYLYQSDRSSDYNNHRIEVQIRSRIQHAWATAVEIAGIFVRSPLKSSIGPDEWLEFFRYASSAFSILEATPRLHAEMSESEIINELQNIDLRLDARSKLRNFSVAHDTIRHRRRKSDTHFLLTLDLGKNELETKSFSTLADATAAYADAEREFLSNPLVDVVLVSADSIESLSVAYPNYFADTKEFLRLCDRLLS